MIDATGIGRASGRDILIRGTAVHGTNGAGSMGRDRETSGRGGGQERVQRLGWTPFRITLLTSCMGLLSPKNILLFCWFKTFLQGNSLMAAVFMGEGMGNLDWAKFYWKWLRAFIWVLSNGLGEQATGVAELCNNH